LLSLISFPKRILTLYSAYTFKKSFTNYQKSFHTYKHVSYKIEPLIKGKENDGRRGEAEEKSRVKKGK
jgi:hypothetical protein